MPARITAGLPAFLLLHAAALAGGAAAAWAHIPLPWMIGSMLAGMAMALSGFDVPGARRSRRLGQLVVGLAIGSYFTADALAQTLRHFDLMIATAVATLGFGFVAMAVLRRLARTDATTAFFASVPGGPVEMALLAERHGSPGAPVALAQAFRIALLVLIVPPAMTWARIDGSDAWLPPAIAVDHRWLPALVLGGAAAGWLLDRLGVSNAALLGGMAAAGVLALAPGSVTEMSLTAKLLHLGVPLVVAFHIVRIVILVLITPAVFAGLRRIRHRMPQLLFGGD